MAYIDLKQPENPIEGTLYVELKSGYPELMIFHDGAFVNALMGAADAYRERYELFLEYCAKTLKANGRTKKYLIDTYLQKQSINKGEANAMWYDLNPPLFSVSEQMENLNIDISNQGGMMLSVENVDKLKIDFSRPSYCILQANSDMTWQATYNKSTSNMPEETVINKDSIILLGIDSNGYFHSIPVSI